MADNVPYTGDDSDELADVDRIGAVTPVPPKPSIDPAAAAADRARAGNGVVAAAEPAVAEPAEGEPEEDPADGDPGEDFSDVEPGGEPVDVEPGGESADVESGEEPVEADTENEPTDGEHGDEPADVEAGDEPVDADAEDEPADGAPEDEPTDGAPEEEPSADEPEEEPADIEPDGAPGGELSDDESEEEPPAGIETEVSGEVDGEVAEDVPDTDTPAEEVLGTIAAAAVASDASEEPDAAPGTDAPAIRLAGLVKAYGGVHAVDGIDLEIPSGALYGVLGPNGAGKTTTLSMIAGLLRPDAGTITIGGIDLAEDPRAAKALMGLLPDRLHTFDRLSGRQLLFYYGTLRGLDAGVVNERIADLARVFDLGAAMARRVSDYSAGMVKKIMLAGALIHSPRVLVLDEPFEAVDPVSSAVILDILTAFVGRGGTVVLSSHGMDLIERACTHLAVLVEGRVLAAGSLDEVRDGLTLEKRYLELAGGVDDAEGLEWLHTFSD
ncbi:ATP-binding cassette domain-containing protein [Microbacterium sp.]|uniref:ATP-binding cassette domain-containing protein n=1 Tax=Microbacterium sp. TaxID=51671 RepID=UPI003A89D731